MKIIAFLLSKKVHLNEITKELDIVGIFNTMNSKGFPARHPEFTVTLIVEDVKDKEHEFEVTIKKGGKLIAKTSKKVETGRRHYYIARFNNIVFPEPGVYEVKGGIDEKKISTSLYLNLSE
ncbi:MAG: hypothetical protein KJI71_04000 [Patescibacteria group bacterium]|nr:hypothetical protein [Patescibacteria group bacterium]